MTTQPAALVRQTSSQIIAVAETIRQNLENVQTRDHLSNAVTKPGKGKDKVKSAIDNSEKFCKWRKKSPDRRFAEVFGRGKCGFRLK